jgi:hypothetical protein
MLHSLSVCLERLSKTVETSEKPEPVTISICNILNDIQRNKSEDREERKL